MSRYRNIQYETAQICEDGHVSQFMPKANQLHAGNLVLNVVSQHSQPALPVVLLYQVVNTTTTL